MGLILIGIALGALIFFLMMVIGRRTSSFLDYFGPLLIALLLFGGIITGLFLNTGGYMEPEESETIELESLRDQAVSTNNSRTYVEVGIDNTFTYFVRVESEFATEGSKVYSSKTVSGKNAFIVEEKDCDMPRLTKYRADSIATFWSFGIGDRKIYYVFYVPEGTVFHSFKLGE